MMTRRPEGGDTTTEGGLGGRCCPVPEVPRPLYYDVTVRGEPGDVLRRAFSDVTVRQSAGVTVLSADLDQAGLHGLLGRIADLGLELVGVRLLAHPGQSRATDPG